MDFKEEMMNFHYQTNQTHLIFGKGTLREIGKEVKKIGDKALLVTGKTSMKRLGFLDRTMKYLEDAGVETYHYDKVQPNPTVDNIQEGAEEALRSGSNVIIG